MTPEEMQQVIAAQQAQLAQLQGQQGAQQPQVQAPLMPAPQPQPISQQAYYPQPQPQPAYPLPQQPMWGATPAVQPPMPCEISIPIKLRSGEEILTVGVIMPVQNLSPESVSQAVAAIQARGFTLGTYKPKQNYSGNKGGWS